MAFNDKNRDKGGLVGLAVLCGVLQLAVAPYVALGNGRANFAMVFSALIAMLVGGRRGVICGFLSGLFFDLCTTGAIGVMAFCLTVSSFVLGGEERNRLSGDFGAAVMSFAVAAFFVSLGYHFSMLLLGQADGIIDVLVFRTLPTTLLTVVGFLPFAYHYSRTHVTGAGMVSGGQHGRRGAARGEMYVGRKR